MTQDALLETAKAALLPNYAPPDLVLTRGEGSEVEDRAGRRYLDLAGGIAVTSVGHCHPKLSAAIAAQAARLMHVSNLFYNDRAIALAGELTERTAFERVYFCNSGAEANETLIKLARRAQFERGQTDRVEIIATEKSFHGRTLGALSITGQSKYHVGMGPLLPGVRFVPYGDLDAMKAAIGPKTAGVILEPVQAEGGIIVPPAGYLAGVREACDAEGALLLFDEVQTGYGRLGTFLGAERFGVVADACSLAKGIAGGFPLAAVLIRESLKGGLPPGSHASTFGGNALACAAGLAVLEVFDEEALLASATERGQELAEMLDALVAQHDVATERRGLGLLQGVALGEGVDPIAVYGNLRDRGVLATLAGGNVVRFVPALNVSREQLEKGVAALSAALAAVSGND